MLRTSLSIEPGKNSWEHGISSNFHRAIWATGLTNDSRYLNGERSWLLSPRFNLRRAIYPVITFRMWVNSEHGYDGVAVELLNGNANSPSWIRLWPEPRTDLWTRVSALNWTGNEMGFTGNSNGLQTFNFSLADNLETIFALSSDSVFLRIVFSSDEVVNRYTGFGLDYVRIGSSETAVTTTSSPSHRTATSEIVLSDSSVSSWSLSMTLLMLLLSVSNIN
jgi:hypothetical protein